MDFETRLYDKAAGSYTINATGGLVPGGPQIGYSAFWDFDIQMIPTGLSTFIADRPVKYD
jgi:hypothetical protein